MNKQQSARGFRRKLAVYRRWLRPKWTAARRAALTIFLRLVPRESQRVFVLTLIIGAVCGLAAVAFHLAILRAEDLLINRALAMTGWWFVAVTILLPTLGGLISGWLLQNVVPGARGSGIPQVKVAYEIKGGKLPLQDAAGKFLIGALQIGSGASLGREGPTVHICAGIASALGRTFALSQNNLRRLLPVGAAAGIAAAFNAPIAAVTFTIEEVVGDLDQTVLSGVVVAAAIAAAIERSILGEHPVFTITQQYGLHNASSLVFYAALGVAAGLVALVFTESLIKLRGAFRRLRVVPVWAQPGVGGFVTGVLAVVALTFLKTGGVTGAGYETLSSALAGQLAWRVMAVLCLLKIAATVFSYSSGGAGGIFAPALFIGAMLGGVVGFLDVQILGDSPDQIGAFALVGMGAAFAGIVRAPITSVLIIFEMTGSYGLILPLMIANMTAYGLARRISPTSIYDALLEQDNIHLPHRQQPAKFILEQIKVAEAMTREVFALQFDLSVDQALRRIESKDFSTFPVVDAERRLIGIVTEARLRRLQAEDNGGVAVQKIVNPIRAVHPDHALSRAVVEMNQHKARQIAVVERGATRKLIGILTMTDVMRVQAELLSANAEIERSVMPNYQ